jgi:uncharacterized membrane protein YheB (UPF0754 family)
MIFKIIWTVLLSSLIGYFTNYLAIKMLFRPRKSFFGFQGLLIKRKTDLAASLSSLVVDRLLSDGAGKILPGPQMKDLLTHISKEIVNTLTADLKTSSG